MTLAGRLYGGATVLVVAMAAAAGVLTHRALRRRWDAEMASELFAEARLTAAFLPTDSSAWRTATRDLSALLGHSVTLVDASGHVRGEPKAAETPEIHDALTSGEGWSEYGPPVGSRVLAVAVRTGPAGVAAVRVSASLDSEDDALADLTWSILASGAAVLVFAALFTPLVARPVTRPLALLGATTRAIAAGESTEFPTSPVREISTHILSLHAMRQELVNRFAELRREREETQTLIESMADGVLATDAAGHILMVNTAARQLLALRAAGQPPPLAELFHDNRARDLVRTALEGEEIDQRELELEARTVLVTSRPLPNGGALLVLRDVTALRRLEAVRRDFVANVSHELKTPLTSIAGYAETLVAESDGRAHAQQFAETILSNARRMQRLVDDLLDLSRIESGAWHPTRRLVDMAALAREAWAPFADRALAQEVSFTVDVGPGAATLAIDPDAFRQIFTNLFDNALRHTPRGGAIGVEAREASDGALVAVRDTGSGIVAEHLPRIFERFYRADAGRARAQGGTGLGLAIVKHLAEAHGGRVNAISGLGAGTTIEILLPGAAALS